MPPKKKQKTTGGSAKPPPPQHVEVELATPASPNAGKTKKVTCGGKEYMVEWLDGQQKFTGLNRTVGVVKNPEKYVRFSNRKEFLCGAAAAFSEEDCLCNKYFPAHGNRLFGVTATGEGENAKRVVVWLCANCQQNCNLLDEGEKRQLVSENRPFADVPLTTGDNKTIARLGPGSCVTFAEELSSNGDILIRVKDPPSREEMADVERAKVLFHVRRTGKRRGSAHLACKKGDYEKVYKTLEKCENVAKVWREIERADDGRFFFVISVYYRDGKKVSFVPHVDIEYRGKPEKRSNWTVYMKKVEDESDYKIMRFQDRQSGWWFDIVCTHGTIVEQSKYASGIHIKDENGKLFRSPIVHAVFNADGTCTITWDHGKKCDGTIREFFKEEVDAVYEMISDDEKEDGEYSDDEDSEEKKPAHLKDDNDETQELQDLKIRLQRAEAVAEGRGDEVGVEGGGRGDEVGGAPEVECSAEGGGGVQHRGDEVESPVGDRGDEVEGSAEGVAITRMNRVQDENEMASRLNPGDWVLFKGSDWQLVWLGMAVGKQEWSNKCIWKNETRSMQVVDSVSIGPNEYGINVQWYTLKQADSPLEYVIESEYPPIVNNNRELLHARFQMKEHGDVWTIEQRDKDVALSKLGH